MRACMSDAKTQATASSGCAEDADGGRARDERAAADQAAQHLGQRRHVDGEPMTFKRPEGEGQARQHRLRLQQFQHAVAPGIEKRQRAGIPHQLPQPVEPVRGIARQERQRAGVGLVGLDAAPIEQPDVGQRAEQRAPVCARAALFQVLDVADEDRDARALLGDDVELIQSCSSRPRVRRARNSWTAVSRAQREMKTRLPFSSPTQPSAIRSGHSSMR